MSHRMFSSPIATAVKTLLTATSLLAVSCVELHAQTRFWLSADEPSGGAAPVASEIEVLLGEQTEIALWAKPTTTLENFSLNLVSTSETALQFDSVEVENGEGSDRFEFVFDTSNGLVVGSGFCDHDDLDFDTLPTHAIWDIRGFTLDSSNGTGLAAEATGTRLATIAVTGLELGSTELYLQIGEIGINELGTETNLTSVGFGDPDDVPLLNGDFDRCKSSNISDATISIVEALTNRVEVLLGDFNDDGLVDATDMDLLSAEALAGTNTAKFDLAGDSSVDALDRFFWVTVIKETVFGDANLDQTVDFADFLLLSNAYAGPGGWGTGDFDGDANITFADFLLLGDAFTVLEAASPSAVPEPSGTALTCGAILCLLCWRRRRSARFEF